MRTSLNEIRQIERYLSDGLTVAERAAFETRLPTDYHLRVNVSLQKKIYNLLSLYKKRKFKREAERVHDRLFNAPEHEGFQRTILKLFNS